MAVKCPYLVLFLLPNLLLAQEKTDLQQILERLDRLERENRTLAAEVHSLRAELAASHPNAPGPTVASSTTTATQPGTESQSAPPQQAPSLDERVAVAERRIDEQAQTKVEAAHKLPISLTGTVLFNAFLNGRAAGGVQDPTTAALTDNPAVGGASMQQSIIGFKFQGPQIWGGGQVNGAVYLDLFGGTSSSLNHLVRLRVADINVDWKNTSILVGQDKPIISPREPNSLAQVGVSPLTGAGNLWLWQPQARVEQRFSLGRQAGLRAQVGIYETAEATNSTVPSYYVPTLSTVRPALEGRFEFWRQFGENSRLEIAPGFHTSRTHINGVTVPSNLFTVDWMLQPSSALQFTGMFFHGDNDGGLGGLRQGFTIFDTGRIGAVQATGGWGQLSYFATKRLTFNIYGGQEDDRGSDLLKNEINRNLVYAANAVYRLGSNVLLGLEASQVRTSYVQSLYRLTNHYDLAVAYLF